MIPLETKVVFKLLLIWFSFTFEVAGDNAGQVADNAGQVADNAGQVVELLVE